MTEESNDTKTCPFCAETIKAAAIVCKHCGRDLPKEESADELLMRDHGITSSDGRYVWRGNHFKNLADAVAYATKPSVLDILGGQPSQHKPIFEGLPPATQAEERLPFWPMTLVAVVVLFGIWLASSHLGSTTSAADPKRNARAAIELCWQDHDRKSLDPETKRFIAGACEMKEREFVTKYGVKP